MNVDGFNGEHRRWHIPKFWHVKSRKVFAESTERSICLIRKSQTANVDLLKRLTHDLCMCFIFHFCCTSAWWKKIVFILISCFSAIPQSKNVDTVSEIILNAFQLAFIIDFFPKISRQQLAAWKLFYFSVGIRV